MLEKVRRHIDRRSRQARHLKPLRRLLPVIDGVIGQEPHGSRPGLNRKDLVSSIGETAYQRAIVNSCSSMRVEGHDLDIDWIGYELPVVPGANSRRRCIDLLGVEPHWEVPIVAELKYVKPGTKSESDSPFYAMYETLAYYFMILEHAESLPEDAIDSETFSWSSFRRAALLAVMANDSYWDHWGGKAGGEYRDLFLDEVCEIMSFLRRRCDLDAAMILVSGPDADFEVQRAVADGDYRPTLPEDVRWRAVSWGS